MGAAAVEGQPLVAPKSEHEREVARLEDMKTQQAATTGAKDDSRKEPLSAPPNSTVAQYSVHHGHTVVPAYPYNVSMSPFIPGSSSSKQDSYFEQHVPDDSNVQTRLPSICVDYLSHDWQEDDVWTSWKAMTKHKSEIANGVRLENASWRTWAKQRGRLKTISPETLNWLKDSDVTWLYGPLHTAVDPVPKAKSATAEDRLGLDKTGRRASTVVAGPSASTSYAAQVTVKPILKHRSLSDILSVPSSGAASPVHEGGHTYFGSGSEDDASDEDSDPARRSAASSTGSTPTSSGYASPANGSKRPRPGKTKSESSVSADSRKAKGRRNSPPRNAELATSGQPGKGEGDEASLAAAVSGAGGVDKPGPSSLSTDSKDAELSSPSSAVHYDLPSELRPDQHDRRGSSFHSTSSFSSHGTKPKRHITFNHRVDQCISIDVIEDSGNVPRGALSGRGAKGGAIRGGTSQPYSNQLQRYGGSSGSGKSALPEEDSDTAGSNSDEEDILTFKSSSPKSPSYMKPLLSPTDPLNPGNTRKRQGSATSGSVQDHLLDFHTIQKMAPTTLKESELLPGPTPIVVFEDGRITALYGTEDDYVFDVEQQEALERERRRVSKQGYVDTVDEEAVADEEIEMEGVGKNDSDDDEESGSSTEEEDEHYNQLPAAASPASKATASVASGASPAALQANALVAAQAAEPISTSSRFASEGSPSIALNAGVGNGIQGDYFAGPDPAVSDNYDPTLLTSSQAKYTTAGAALPDKRGDLLSSTTSSSTNSSATVSPSASAAGIGLIDLSSSPSSRAGIPTKSILKKGREPAPGGEYYPPMPPASTRASRAHATMFDENGDEIVNSPRSGKIIALPEESDRDRSSASVPTAVVTPPIDLSHSHHSPSSAYFSPGSAGNAASSPPTRGRSISRGSSSSSLIDRAGSSTSLNSGSGSLDYYNANANGRTRSISGGSSVSPGGSYTESSYIGAVHGGAPDYRVSSSQPIDIRSTASSGGNVQSTKASAKRTALYDTESEDDSDSGSSTQEEDETAAEMEFTTDVDNDLLHKSEDSAAVRFTRTSPNRVATTRSTGAASSSTANNAATMKQYHQRRYDEDDDSAMVEDHVNDQQDFESRPTLSNAANVGRGKGSVTDPTTSSGHGKDVGGTHPKEGSMTLRESTVTQAAKKEDIINIDEDAKKKIDPQKVKDPKKGVETSEETEEDLEEKLFESPYMPSSPHFSSQTNLPDFRWADKPKSSSSSASTGGSSRGKSVSTSKSASRSTITSSVSGSHVTSPAKRSLIRNLSSSSGAGNSTFIRRSSDNYSSSDSDPSAHGPGYGYGFDLSDDDDEERNKGVVGRAIDLAGGAKDLATALWNVGSGMWWRGSSAGGAATEEGK